MPGKLITTSWKTSWAGVVGGAMVVLSCQALLGQTISNPSFESEAYTAWPGYISYNTPLTGWVANMPSRAGLNPANGSPFADNGAIPDGNNVAFIQSGINAGDVSALTNTISGLTVGRTYKVVLRATARNAGEHSGAGQYPDLRIAIDGTEVLALNVYSVAAAGQFNTPYSYIAFEFTATATAHELSLANDVAPTDATVVVDNITIAPSSGNWVVKAWTGDADSGIDPSYLYTHAYSFGTSSGVNINGVSFSGAGGVSPRVTGKFSTTFTGNVLNNSWNNNVADSSHGLANDFVYGGNIPAGQFESITLTDLTPGTQYVATLYSTAWDAPSLALRWVTFGMGQDRLTVSQDQFGLGNGITVSCTYTADATGSATIQIAPINPKNVSFHICGFSNREAVSRDVAPAITQQPQSTAVSVGLPVVLSIAATGIPTPTYQWRFNGTPIDGAQNTSYVIAAPDNTSVGNYDVVVSNRKGTVVSSVATLAVGMALANPSFEADEFFADPGYSLPNNFPITGWTFDDPLRAGLNPVFTDGVSPFANNGMIPNGAQVAFIQGNSDALRQIVTGFTVGSVYYVSYYENSRSGYGIPWLQVTVGGATVLPAHPIPAVGGSSPYHWMLSDLLVATNASLELAFVKSDPVTGSDSTALIDNVTVFPIAPGSAPFASRNPQPVLVSVGDSAAFTGQGLGTPPLSYQWLKNGSPISAATTTVLNLSNIQKPADADYSLVINNSFGSATTAVVHLTVYEPVPGLLNSGVDNNQVVLADNSIDSHWQIVENPDSGSPNAIVEDSTVFPISTGNWMAESTTSKWIGPDFNTAAAAAGEYTYRTVLDLTGRDPSTLVIIGQWATDNEGLDIRVNGVSTHNPESLSFASFTGFSIYGTNALYAANLVAGSNNLDFVMQNDGAGATGLRLEIIRSNLRIPPGVPPQILTPPLSQIAATGDTVTFTAAARGTAPLSYQWEKNGMALPGQTTLTLTLTNLAATDSGFYSILVSNSAGSTNSLAAALNVAFQVIPRICFGTGLAADGSLLTAPATDPHYILAVSADPNFPGPNAFVVSNAWPVAAAWLANGPNSAWIAPQSDQSGTAYPDGTYGGNYSGNYTYETAFDLTGQNLSKVFISGGWAVDNTGIDIVVNGVNSGHTATSFAALAPFILTVTNGLVAGQNIVDFVMNNGVQTPDVPGPTGLKVDMRLLSIIPPKLQLLPNGANLNLVWWPALPNQQLLSAPTPKGPWTTITGATSPYVVTAGATNAFYRVSQ